MATKDSNPSLPDAFQRGQRLKAADLEMMRSAIAFALDGMIGAGPGLTIAKRGAKWIISAARDKALAEAYCFKTMPVIGSAKVTFIPGTVEGIIPKIGASWAAGVFINDTTPPELTVATGYNYLDCKMDGAGVFTEVMILNASSVPANTSTQRRTPISTVTVSGTTVTVTAQAIRTSVSHVYFGGASTWGQV